MAALVEVRHGRDHHHPSTDRPAWRLGHRPGLDGLRGIAFAMVLAGHAGWPLARTRAHELGVELFFVLSGFLITALLLDEHARDGRVDLWRFSRRRIRRLIPALVAVVGVTAVVARWTSLLDWGDTRRGAIGALTYSSNIVKVHGWGLGPFGHLWSLAVEEHFYLVWPAVLLVTITLARRWARPGLVLAVPVALAAACFAWRVWLVARGGGDDLNTRLYYPTDTRVLGPLAGCALAVVKVHGVPPLPLRFDLAAARLRDRIRRRPIRRVAASARLPGTGPRWWRAWSPAALAGTVGALLVGWLSTGPGITDRPAMFVAGLPLATLAGIALCAACAADRPLAGGGLAPEPSLVARALGIRPLRWLGRISYGGYLVHYPIYVAFGYEMTGMSTGQALTVIILSLVAAVLVERLVERPFRARPSAPSRPPHPTHCPP